MSKDLLLQLFRIFTCINLTKKFKEEYLEQPGSSSLQDSFNVLKCVCCLLFYTYPNIKWHLIL